LVSWQKEERERYQKITEYKITEYEEEILASNGFLAGNYLWAHLPVCDD
jgi:hypothetical protein